MKRLDFIYVFIKKYLFFLLFIGITFAANGQTANVEGTWVIDQVKFKKTVYGVTTEKTYSMTQHFDAFIECPQKITFTDNNKIIFEYRENEPKEGTYLIEGDLIRRITAEAPYEYRYTITDTGKIQLHHSVNYLYNYGDGLSDKITEEYSYYGYRK